MPAGRDPVAAHRHRDQVVQAACHHRGSARHGPPEDHGPIQAPLKVLAPALAPGMEQPHAPLGPRIAPMGLLALAQIAQLLTLCRAYNLAKA